MSPDLSKRLACLAVILVGTGYACSQLRAQTTTQRVHVGVQAIAVIGLDAGIEVLNAGDDGSRIHRLTFRLTSNVKGLTIRATLDDLPQPARAALRAESQLGTTRGFQPVPSGTSVDVIRELNPGVEKRGVLDFALRGMPDLAEAFNPGLTLDLVGPDGRIHDHVRVFWIDIVGDPVAIAESDP